MLADQPGQIASWEVTQDWIHKNVRRVSASSNLCIVTGFCDSMRPLYNPGDPLLVDVGVMTVAHDGIYFFRVGNEGFVKRLQRVPGAGIMALSENKAYRDWTVPQNGDFAVLGKVLKVWCGTEF